MRFCSVVLEPGSGCEPITAANRVEWKLQSLLISARRYFHVKKHGGGIAQQLATDAAKDAPPANLKPL